MKHYTVLGLTDTSKAIGQLPTIGTPKSTTMKATGTTDATPLDNPQQYPHQRQRESVQHSATVRDELDSEHEPADDGT